MDQERWHLVKFLSWKGNNAITRPNLKGLIFLSEAQFSHLYIIVSTICNVSTYQISKFDVIFVDCWNGILYISRVYFGEVRFKELGEGK